MSEEALGVDLQRGSTSFPRPIVVRLVDPDPTWADQAATWAHRLVDLPWVHGVEHVGATAVPELAAVGLLDLVATLDGSADPTDPALGVALEVRGYDDRGGGASSRVFRRAADPDDEAAPSAVELRVTVPEHPLLARQVAFRDVLRGDAAARRRYTEVRRGLSGDWADLAAYRTAKGPVIAAIGREHGID